MIFRDRVEGIVVKIKTKISGWAAVFGVGPQMEGRNKYEDINAQRKRFEC
jgi:hypothetical protein